MVRKENFIKFGVLLGDRGCLDRMKLNKLGLYIFPLVLLASMVLANTDWVRFGDEPTSEAPHEVIDALGLFTNESALSSCSISHGIQAGTEPLVYDFDGDGDLEMFLPSIDDNFIRIYNEECVLEEERNLGIPDGQACLFDGALNEDWGSGVTIFLKIDNNFTVMQYNGSFLNVTKSYSMNWTRQDGNLTNVTKPYLSCSGLNYGEDLVYYVDDYNVIIRFDNNTRWNSTLNLTLTYPSDSIGDNNIDDYFDNVSIAVGSEGFHTPVYFVNLDKYGSFFNMIWRYKDIVYQFDATGSDWINNLSGSCWYNYGTFIHYLVIADENAASDYSVFVANDGNQVGWNPTEVTCLRKILSDGTTDWTNSNYYYTSFYSDGDLRGDPSIVSFGVTSSGFEKRIWVSGGGHYRTACFSGCIVCSYREYDFDGTEDVYRESTGCNLLGGLPNRVTGGFNVWNLLKGTGTSTGKLLGDIYNDSWGGSRNAYLINFPNTNSIIVDIDGDNLDEIINFGTDNTKIYKSGFANEPPNLYNNISYGGYYGYMNPVCVNSTALFLAAECYAFDDCNYDNDLGGDLERIVSNCGVNPDGSPNSNPTTFRSEGSYDLAQPEFYCYYNVTGTFSVRLYLQDTANDDDYSVFNTQSILINVIDGIPGSTCNIPGTQITVPSDNEPVPEATPEQEAIDNSIDSTMGILFGTSSRMKLIVGLAIIIGVIVLVAKHTKGAPIPTIAGAILTLIMVTFLGFFDIWIMLLVLIAMLLLMFLIKFIVPSGNGAGG